MLTSIHAAVPSCRSHAVWGVAEVVEMGVVCAVVVAHGPV